MKHCHNTQIAAAALAGAVLATAGCTLGSYPPDEHNKLAKPFIHDSAAFDPFGVLMAGATSVKRDQVFNLSDGLLEGGTEVQLLAALPEISPDALDAQQQTYEALIGPFTAPVESESGFDSSKLPPHLWTEYGTLLNRAERMMFRIREEREFETNPLKYVEKLGLLLYAPLHFNYAPEADRFAAIVQRLSEAPRYLQTARSNLTSASQARIEAAREATQGVIDLIREDIAQRIPAGMQASFERVVDPAVAALETYRNSLGDLPASDDWRAGAALVQRKLELDSGRPLAPIDALIEEITRDLDAAHASLVAAAEPINRRIYGGSRPRDDYRLIHDVLEVLEGENRARNNAGMLEEMAKDTNEARDICNEEEIAPVPKELELQVVETPEFMRVSVPLGGGLGPSAAASDNTAVVWLTPAPADASRSELRSRLTTNNIYQLKLLAMRYGIPGYALIGSLASDMESEQDKLRHMVEPLPGFIHGWPIYITETMVGTYYTGDVDFIWRKYKLQTIAAALVDIQLHAKDLSMTAAQEFLTRRAYMESSAARALLRSLEVNPTQAATVYFGWKNWQLLRAHYQETTQDFSLTSFHGKALRMGSMPLVELSYAVSEAKGRLSLTDSEN